MNASAPYAFELQRGGTIVQTIQHDSAVESAQAYNLARANGETLIGVFEDGHGIQRRILWRPGA